ncbi:MAG: antibiotic biosynthesis monooxygenase [Halioglobus sp.]
MTSVALEGYIVVPDADLVEVTRALEEHIRLTRQEKGCTSFSVVKDPESNNRFNVYEEFCSRDAFELHQQRVASSKWGRITVNVERHYRIFDLE